MTLTRLTSFVGGALILWVATADGAPFELIGPVGTAPAGVSADGSTAVGVFNGFGFRWSETGGFQNIGGKGAFGTNADGSIIAVTVSDQGLDKAASWTVEGGAEILDPVPGAQSCDAFFSSSWGMSDDAVIVGLAWVANCRAHGFRWEESTGSVDLGTSVEGRSSRANGVSGDGQVVVGWQEDPAGFWQAAKWVDSTQTLLWDSFEGEDVMAGAAEAANYDGSVIVGGGAADGGAWRWTGGSYIESIGVVPGFSGRTYALDVSDDGGVIVGAGAAGFSREAFIWTEATGMVELGEYLVSVGITDAVGYNLGTATGVSADGKIIVGWFYQADLSIRGWRIDLNQAPAAVDSSPTASALQVVTSTPNPFRGSTSISYSLATDEIAKLSIYDASGRQVRTLLEGRARAGAQTIEWNGSDDQGRDVPAGTYFLRMENGSDVAVRRLTLLR